MKTCLRRICCNFCFILIATFSKAKISHAKSICELKISTTTAKITSINETNYKLEKIGSNDKGAQMICYKYNKEAIAPIPKKRKRIIKQADFEVRDLPKGDYIPQYENDGNIRITKRTMILKG